MNALCYHAAGDVRYEDVPDAAIIDPRDIIVRMTQAGICGSDLHIYHGSGFSPATGYSIGHEAIGEIVEVGAAVRRAKVGDQVMISAAVGCGACQSCLSGWVARCESGGAGCYGLGPQLAGCQAEYIRVPAGDYNSATIPEGLTPDQALMLTDNLPTAYFGCLNADIKPGKTVAVVGLGPIGLMAVELAQVMGASRVFAIDLLSERRAIAEAMGAEPIDGANAVQAVMAATGGRMAECVVEAVGSDTTIGMAIALASTGGTASVIGVNQNMQFTFPMALAFVKSLTFRIGMCSVQAHWPDLVRLIRAGRLHPERTISHRLPLSDGAEAYRLFDAREGGALKMVLTA